MVQGNHRERQSCLRQIYRAPVTESTLPAVEGVEMRGNSTLVRASTDREKVNTDVPGKGSTPSIKARRTGLR